MRIRSVAVAVASLGALLAAAVPALGHHGVSRHAHSARTDTVRFGEYFYRPRNLTIRAGDSVRFVNVGKIEHTVADATKSGAIRARIIHPRPLGPGTSQTVTLKRPGTVYYVCTFHPSLMRGVIVVTR